jgi:N-acetylglucosaminyldiphosphoundecaprenol N-acetyl-beta-D-mannosaminyltransferase
MTAQSACLHFDGAADGRWAVPVARIGGLPIAVIDRAKSAQLMIDVALSRRNTSLPPLIFSSANGQVLSLCARQSWIRDLFLDADLIQADGMSLVFVSRLLQKTPLPERVCTTDLFDDIARAAPQRGARIFLVGATKSAMDKAARTVRSLYPDLDVVGHASGYFRRDGDEDRTIDAINTAQPDILWLGLGVPAEQSFAVRHRSRLRVGLIKTAGGLYDYLSGQNTRAPSWMRAAGLEWAYRMYLEPRRLFGRYLTTNPHALFLLLTRTRLTNVPSLELRERRVIR